MYNYQGAHIMKSCLVFKVAVLVFFLSHIECAFRCDYNYSVEAQGWIKHFVIPATWSDARLRCSLEGAILASPTTPEIKAEMKKILKNFFSPGSEVFTGIHATFSPGSYATVEEGSGWNPTNIAWGEAQQEESVDIDVRSPIPVSKTPLSWAENEPDNLNNNEQCITFNYNGDLADRSCSATRPFICYRSIDREREVNECGTVDPEYRLDKRTNSCYKFHTVPRTFSRAHFACTAEGGHLAIINSDTEATVLAELFAKYPFHKMTGTFWKDVAFVGFADWGEHGEWRTIHGQTLSEAGYDKFSLGEPNNSTTGEYCGSIYRTGRLNDLWCNNVYAFICEKSPDYPAVCRPEVESKNY